MERTISFMNGEGSIGHNTRRFIADNVDASCTKDNITLIHEDIKQAYHKLFTRHLRNTMQNRNARTGRLKVIMIRFPEANRKNCFMRLSFR